MNPIRVLIVDDDDMICEGLRAILEVSEAGVEVVGIASDGLKAIELAVAEQPDVVLMDLRMPGMGGIEATCKLLEDVPTCKVLVLTTFNDDDLIYGALEAGARGYLLKGVKRDELLRAIGAVAQGAILLSPDVAQRLLKGREPKVANQGIRERLSEREFEILSLMARGQGNREISHQLFLSEGTIKNYASRIYERLGVTDRVQAILYARENGLVD